MRGQIWLFVAVVICGAVIAGAQASGSGFSLSGTTACTTPGKGFFTVCKPAAGGPVQMTDEGLPWPPASSSSIPASFGCTLVLTPQTVSSTGVITYQAAFSGCK